MNQGEETAGRIDISFVVATFNSERHLDALCRSIRESVDEAQQSVEIFAVDGGSTDQTIQIAQDLGMIVLKNPKGNAIAAKHLGLWAARGRYVCFMDHDERFQNVRTVDLALQTFKAEPSVRAIMTSGYILERTESGSNWYASEFGDPVSLFLYRTPNRYEVRETTFLKKFAAFRRAQFASIVNCAEQEKPLLCELVAAASFVDADFLRTTFGVELAEANNLPQAFYLLGKEANRLDEVGLLRECPIHHESVSSWRQVRAKVRWRIGNAVVDQEGIGASGLSGRRKLENRPNDSTTSRSIPKHWRLKFLVYAVSLVGPFVDALEMSLRRRKMAYMMHLPLSLYVVFAAAVMKTKAILGVHAPNRRYDGTPN